MRLPHVGQAGKNKTSDQLSERIGHQHFCLVEPAKKFDLDQNATLALPNHAAYLKPFSVPRRCFRN
jgi:hypothetical protein